MGPMKALAAIEYSYITPFLKSIAQDLEKACKWTDADKIISLDLFTKEWEKVEHIMELLEIPNEAQQTFSADKFKDFLSMLHPNLKFKFIQKNWLASDSAHAKEMVKRVFSQRFKELQARATSADAVNGSQTKKEFNKYLKTKYKLEATESAISWWGLQKSLLPTWSSLALDYLAIMASLVSSERAFSSAGLTITKHRSRLKADIVEALQVIKFAVRNDTLSYPAHFTLVDEMEFDGDDTKDGFGDIVDNEDDA
ncbi:hypothetical protein FRC03_000360 [Tulasnella sp. 419]|nr:hypothetical protein FRC03_000360 [Tulasnella sp. 419]